MKILYIAPQHRAADVAAGALRTVGPHIVVSWVSSLSAAERWVTANRNVATLILEVGDDDPSAGAFVSHIRALGVSAPLVVVSLNEPVPALPVLRGVADHILAKGRSFANELPQVVSRALHTAQPPDRRRLFADAVAAVDRLARSGPEATSGVDRAARDRDALSQLDRTVAAIAARHEDHARSAVDDGSARRDAELAARLRQAETARDESARRLAETEAALRRAEERATLQQQAVLRDADERRAALTAELAREAANRARLEQTLAAARLTLQRVEAQHAAAMTAAEARWAERQTQVNTQLSEGRDGVTRVREQHAHELKEAASRLAERERDAETRLARAAGEIAALQRRVTETAATLERAETQAAAERQQAADEAAARQAAFDAERRQELGDRPSLVQALEEARAARQRAEAEHALALQQAARRVADLQRQSDARSAEAATAIEELRSRLIEGATALQEAEQRAAHDRQAMAKEAAERRAAFTSELLQEGAKRQLVDEQRAAAERGRQQADEQRAAAEQAREQADERRAAAEQATREADEQRAKAEHAMREAEAQHAQDLATTIARLTGAQMDVEQQLADAQATVASLEGELGARTLALASQADEAARDRAAAATAAADRQRTFDAACARQADEAAREREAAATMAATRQREFDATLAEADAGRQTLEVRLADAIAAHERARAEAQGVIASLERALADRTAAFDRLTDEAARDREAAATAAAERQRGFDTALAEADAGRQALDAKLADAAAAHEHARGEAAAAQERTRAEAATAIGTLERALADRTAAFNRLTDEAARAREVAAAAAAARQREFDAALAEADAGRQALDARLADAAAAHARARSDAETAMGTLERALADRTAAFDRLTEEAARASQAAEAATIERRQEFHAALARAEAGRQALETRLADAVAAHERALAEAETARQRADGVHAAALAAAAAELADVRREAERQAAGAAAEAQAALQAVVDRAAADRQTASREATDREAAFDAERRQAATAREALETELASARAASGQAERRFLDQVTDMRQRAREHEARLEERASRERAEWETTLADRDARARQVEVERDLARQSLATTDARLADAARAHGDERATFERTLGEVKADLAQTVAARDEHARTLAGLQHQFATLTASLESAAREREVLKTEADRVPGLLHQLATGRAEQDRRFEDHPLAFCRCSPDGTITRVNRSLARLLGYDRPEDLQTRDVASAVFESGAELPWIVAKRFKSGSSESVETTWKRRDGSRLLVSLRIVATTPEAVDLAAEDITPTRALEEKLRTAQRMEAVARYAAEVAATCDTLLGDIKHEAEEWLAALPDGAARYHGELLLDEVTRATTLLRQLSVYGQQQKDAPALVNLRTVLPDLAPVLTRVAGAAVEVALPETPAPLHVDVDAERVERILVNVAAYARGRMRSNGRLRIEAGALVPDRDFVEKYPTVRPGAHVVLTVTEARGTSPAEVEAALGQASGAQAAAGSSGLDLGTLQGLVGDCGGHLWMMTEPSGNLVLKIHLPRRALDDLERPVPAKVPAHVRWLGRIAGVKR